MLVSKSSSGSYRYLTYVDRPWSGTERQNYEVYKLVHSEVWHGWKYKFYNWRAVEKFGTEIN